MASAPTKTIHGAAKWTFLVPPSDCVLAKSLAASTAEDITVPSGAVGAVFSATADFYANYTTTATVPGDVTDGSASELNPTTRDVTGVTTISVISPTTAIVTVAFYK